MREHYDSWLYMATSKLALDIEPEQLAFISGTIKTARYIAAMFEFPEGQTGEVTVHYDLYASPNPTASVTADCGLERFAYRSGSTAQASFQHEGAAPEGHFLAASDEWPPSLSTQCIFVHFFRMKRRVFWMAEIRAAAGPHNLPDGDDSDGPDGRDPRIARDAVDAILNYILGVWSQSPSFETGTNLTIAASTPMRNSPLRPPRMPRYFPRTTTAPPPISRRSSLH